MTSKEQINNLKQQVIDLKVANKDKYETIKAMKQELLEYSELRDRFKVLYEENQKLKKAIEIFKNKLHIEFDDKYNEINFKVFASAEIDYVYFSLDDDKQQYNLLKEVLSDDK